MEQLGVTREEWKYCTMEHVAQSVMISGTFPMPELLAGEYSSNHIVIDNNMNQLLG